MGKVAKGIGKAVTSVGKGLLTGGPLGAISAGAELLGGYMSNKKQNANAAAQQGQYNQALGAVQGPSQYEQMLQGFLGQQSPQSQYNAQQIDPSQFSQQPNQAINAGQDALMQFLNRDPAQQLGQAGTTLSNLAATGGAQNAQSLVDQLQPLQQLQTQQQVAGLNAQVSGLGQRLGTANRIGEARLRAQLGAQNNAQNAGIYQQTFENAANRQLSAAGTLGGLLQSGQGQRLQAAQGLGQFAQIGQAGNAQVLQALMANQNAGLQANAQNNQAGQAFQQMMQSGYGQLLGAQGQRTGQLVGLQAPQQATTNPLLQGIQTATAIPSLFKVLQK